MQIVLLENILKLGKVGDLVKVKDGYGRNYLIKNGKALRASKENIDFVNKKKDELNKKNNEIKKTFVDLAKKINGKSLSFSKESKENGDLFASIKPKEISSYYKENLNVEITPSQIVLKQEINKIGKYKITINLHSEVSTENTILVKKREIK
jgi:large subunit ribosomal protein L9